MRNRELAADYIRGYAVMAFLSVFLLARFWTVAKEAANPRTIWGWSLPDLLALDYVYLFLVALFLMISVVLGVISFLPFWRGLGIRIVRATSLAMGIIALVSFVLEWEEGFASLQDSRDLPSVVLTSVYYLGLGWFIVLGTITALVPLLSRRGR